MSERSGGVTRLLADGVRGALSWGGDAFLWPIDAVVRAIKTAGAAAESATDRQGFLSYHAETHAAGAGLGLGFAAGAAGSWSLLGGVVIAVSQGNAGDTPFDGKLLRDIEQEKHYFLGAVVAGALAGFGLRTFDGGGLV